MKSPLHTPRLDVLYDYGYYKCIKFASLIAHLNRPLTALSEKALGKYEEEQEKQIT